jgi:tetratricopeptide (TPR) repeat protein/CHAT domain-containing protein
LLVRLDAKRDGKMRATAVALAIFVLLLAVSTGFDRASAQVEPDIDALNSKAAQLYQVQSYAEALLPAKEALALAEQRFAPDDRRLARLLNNLALLHEMLKQYAEAEPFYQRALAIEEKALGPTHAAVGKTLKNLAWLYTRQKRFAEAEPLYQRAVSVLEQATGPELGDLLAALNGYASLYRQQGRFKEALPLSQRALSIAETVAGADHPDLAVALERLAGLYQALGREADAEPLWVRALAIMEKARGADHLDLRPWLQRLAANYEYQRRYGEAERLYQRAIAITEQGLGHDTIELAPWLDKLAQAYHRQSRYPEAEAILKRALAVLEKARGESHADLRRPLDSLAWNYEMQQRYADALPLYQRTLAILEMVLGSEHRDLREPLGKLASVYEAQRRWDDAVPLRQRALAIVEKAYGEDDTVLRISLNSLAFLYKRQGRYREAEPLYWRVLALAEKGQGGADNVSATSARAELIEILNAQARYAEAEPLLRAELAAAERKSATDPNNVVSKMGLHNARNKLGQLLRDTNRPTEAEALFRRALADDEKLDEQHVFLDLVNLGWVLHNLNRLAEAEPLLRRALILAESYGPNYEQARALNSLGTLLVETNHPAEAEAFFRRALQLAESFGYGPHIATALNNLAGVLGDSNRVVEAEALYRRALAIEEQSFGPEHPSVAAQLNNLASLLHRSKRSAEAEALFRRALAIGEKSLGPDHPKVAGRLGNLAELLLATERRAEAEPLLRRALAIDEASYGARHPRVAGDLNSLAGLLKDTHGVEAAEPLVRRALAIDEESYGLQHPHVARDLHNLAVLRAQAGDWAEAEQLLSRAAPIWIGRGGGRTDPEPDELRKGMLREHSDSLRFYALALNRAQAADAAKRARGFEVAQWALQSEAAEALAQMSARLAKGNGPLVDLVRKRQDLEARRHNDDKRLLAAVGQGQAAATAELRASIANLETELAAADVELGQKFPDYANLAAPKPLSIAEVQALLSAEEALLLFLDVKQLAGLPEQTLVWALTRKTVTWHRSPMGTRALADSVQRLRCGLDEAVWNDATGAEQCLTWLQKSREEIDGDGGGARLLPFDLKRANDLYQALLGPVAHVIRDKQLIIVPSGALLSLPFNVLVTEPPKPEAGAGLAAYRQAAWLGMRQPISMLPSVASLAALRRHAKRSTAPEPFLGYGDPVLAGEPNCPRIAVPEACPDEAIRIAGTSHVASRSGKGPTSIASYFRDGQANVAEVRKLCPLPDTAHELKCVARSLGAKPDTVVLGADMTERAVKTAALDRYRVLHFATHGLIAGEVAQLGKGRAEPALVLSPPEQATEEDDGLLTASEVAALKLNADWVVLSACNTASGGEAGAEALSGLARAFFYAGARALLVSHWPVDSYAATMLTSRTFAEMRKLSGLGRAEAFRRAMLALISDDKRPWAAHPSIWAPFTVVGAGAELPSVAPIGAPGKSRPAKAVTSAAEDWHKRVFDP